MPDYPDWYEIVQLVGSDIKVPIDIQAQFITLDINIKAADAQVNVNIAASVVELDIDITAQHIGVFLQPEWAGLQGEDKNFYFYTPVAAGGYGMLDYSVTNGKTLYICGIAFGIHTQELSDYDHFLYLFGTIRDNTAGVRFANLGGVGGAEATFPKPIVIPENHVMRIYLYNFTNLACYVGATCWGYEI